nr:MAG TPA: hypothetical protein [Caudoviricetes sp.]
MIYKTSRTEIILFLSILITALYIQPKTKKK